MIGQPPAICRPAGHTPFAPSHRLRHSARLWIQCTNDEGGISDPMRRIELGGPDPEVALAGLRATCLFAGHGRSGAGVATLTSRLRWKHSGQGWRSHAMASANWQPCCSANASPAGHSRFRKSVHLGVSRRHRRLRHSSVVKRIDGPGPPRPVEGAPCLPRCPSSGPLQACRLRITPTATSRSMQWGRARSSAL